MMIIIIIIIIIMGRHSERNTGLVILARDVSDTRRGSRGGSRKENEHTSLAQSYFFVPVAAETMGAINKDGMDFLSDSGRRITQSTFDHRECAFFVQRLSMLIQRYNAVAALALLGTFAHTTSEDEMYYRDDIYCAIIFIVSSCAAKQCVGVHSGHVSESRSAPRWPSTLRPGRKLNHEKMRENYQQRTASTYGVTLYL